MDRKKIKPAVGKEQICKVQLVCEHSFCQICKIQRQVLSFPNEKLIFEKASVFFQFHCITHHRRITPKWFCLWFSDSLFITNWKKTTLVKCYAMKWLHNETARNKNTCNQTHKCESDSVGSYTDLFQAGISCKLWKYYQ